MFWLSDAPLNAAQQVFAVTFNNQLKVTFFGYLQQQIGQMSLCAWMQMQLRLFKQDDRTFGRGQQHGDNR